jgi:hypothetical protein
MARNALEDQKYELIKAHVLDPDHSPLPPDQRQQLDRVLSMARLLDRQPIQRNAVALHMKKYKGLKRSQAYEDCRIAVKLFNSLHNFDYDFWHQWLINDIIRNIEKCRAQNSIKAMRVIAVEHNNLIKAIGEKPQKDIDPKLTEQHNFYLQVNINGEQSLIDYLKLIRQPANVRKALSDIMIKEIQISEAEEFINS